MYYLYLGLLFLVAIKLVVNIRLAYEALKLNKDESMSLGLHLFIDVILVVLSIFVYNASVRVFGQSLFKLLIFILLVFSYLHFGVVLLLKRRKY